MKRCPCLHLVTPTPPHPFTPSLPPMNWLIQSEAGLLVRIATGVLIFVALAIADLRAHGAAATRWKEYRFLIVVTALAMLYGALNDQITSAISWEYFYYGKDL